MNKHLSPPFVGTNFYVSDSHQVIVRWTDVTDIQKKPGLLQETVKVSTRYLSTTCESFLQQFSLRSESWVFSMYNGECYDLIRQLANLGMRKLISEDSYHQVISHFQTNKLHKEVTLCYMRTSTCC